jgi:hypothetical protein
MSDTTEKEVCVWCSKCQRFDPLNAQKFHWEFYRKCALCGTLRELIRPQAKGNWRYLGFSTYSDYLASDLWKSIRARVLKRDHGQCCRCGRGATQVHHKSYHINVLLGRTLKPLVSICHTCHKAIEFKSTGEKNCLHEANRALKWFTAKPKKPSKSQLKKQRRKKPRWLRLKLARSKPRP